MDLLYISEERCRQCYRCVRGCPTNALKIDHGKVRRIESRCVFCGTCYKFCPHEAIIVRTGIDQVIKLLEEGEKVVACLDPTFPAVLDIGTPGQLVTSLKKLGFQEVWESAFGGDLVTQAYKKWLNENKKLSWISSFCPSLVLYVEKFVPQLVNQLVPVVSPMIAMGMSVKKIRGADTKVVFIGSCISRIRERMDQPVTGIVDHVLIYHDIIKVLKRKGIDREQQKPSEFDSPPANYGRILSISGAMSKCIGFDQDLLNLNYVVAGSSKGAIRAMKQLQDGSIKSKFFDLLFCAGCIDGPIVDKKISGPSRKQIVVNFVLSQQKKDKIKHRFGMNHLNNLNLKRNYSAKDVSMPEPMEAAIQAVLKKLHKSYPNRNLDCGACGYNTCREQAIAVVQRLAEMEMCPHYLMEQLHGLYSRLEKSHEQLKISHKDLELAQRQLIQSEKMASIGQLAAGVAHELNNPMGTITLFGRILQKELSNNERWSKDISLIVQEADRAAKIVKDLLSFSRETTLKPGLLNLNMVIDEALSLLLKHSIFYNIEVKKKLDPSLPSTFADADLLKQAIFNIVLNGAQSMEGRGILTIKSQNINNGQEIIIEITDTGKGIPKENLSRLFDPFFTTREKGTGLGLAIVYTILSKHKGSIQVQSELNKRTTFTLRLPVLDKEKWMEVEKKVVDIKQAKGEKRSETQREDIIG
ncbi:MAG: 4Fe-4S binding protein [Candidatus Aminicenantes bacterium]|nr:4Fe-4S binding protein [Candidatus Aminicenantes bacterium]